MEKGEGLKRIEASLFFLGELLGAAPAKAEDALPH